MTIDDHPLFSYVQAEFDSAATKMVAAANVYRTGGRRR
jgi:hypothetical protein